MPKKFCSSVQFVLVLHLIAIVHVAKYKAHAETATYGNREENREDKIFTKEYTPLFS